MHDQQLDAISKELEGMIPAQQTGAAALGGIWTYLLELKAAVAAKDVQAIGVAVRNLLNYLLGEGATAAARAPMNALNFDWAKLVAILQKLLPIILGS